jgi:hypothetical protein
MRIWCGSGGFSLCNVRARVHRTRSTRGEGDPRAPANSEGVTGGCVERDSLNRPKTRHSPARARAGQRAPAPAKLEDARSAATLPPPLPERARPESRRTARIEAATQRNCSRALLAPPSCGGFRTRGAATGADGSRTIDAAALRPALPEWPAIDERGVSQFQQFATRHLSLGPRLQPLEH